jgi:hypothetical protein
MNLKTIFKLKLNPAKSAKSRENSIFYEVKLSCRANLCMIEYQNFIQNESNIIPIEWRWQFFRFWKMRNEKKGKKRRKMKFLSLKWAIFRWKSGGRGGAALLSKSIMFWRDFERHVVPEIDAFYATTIFWFNFWSTYGPWDRCVLYWQFSFLLKIHLNHVF